MVIRARSEFSFKVSQPHLRIKKRKWRELDRQIIHPHVYISSRYPISNNGEYTSTFYVRTHMLVRVALTFQPQLFDCDRRWKTGSFKDREGGFKITLIMKKPSLSLFLAFYNYVHGLSLGLASGLWFGSVRPGIRLLHRFSRCVGFLVLFVCS